ncbi:MFS transporter [Amycolatopsis japonica]|uniref:MFS transporter n=1 Tax=Amycolatopsis japonica TaxID=208439 RepID=UPI00331E1DDA
MTPDDKQPELKATPQQIALKPGGILTALVLAVVVVQLCNTMLAPALPDMATRLNTSNETVGLIHGFFFLLSGLVSIAAASYSDHMDRRKLVLISLSVTCAGLVVATVAPNIAVLLIGRLLQAASGALFPLALRILRETLPREGFGRGMGIVTAAYAGATSIDVVLAGWLTDSYGFRAVLAFMVLVTAIAIVVVRVSLPNLPATESGRVDRLGTVLLCLSLSAIQAGIGMAANAGLVVAASSVAVGMALFAGFWMVEKRSSAPLIPVDYLRSRDAWPVVATSALTFTGILSVINYTMPVLSQDHNGGYGNSAIITSLAFLVPIALVTLVFSPITGHFAPKIGWRRTLHVALIGAVPVLIALVLAVGQRAEWLAIVMMAVLGVFNAMALTAVNGLSVILAPERNPGILPGINSTAFGVGVSLGITIAAQLAARGPADDPASTTGFEQALWMAAIAVALAFLTSLAVPRRADRNAEGA